MPSGRRVEHGPPDHGPLVLVRAYRRSMPSKEIPEIAPQARVSTVNAPLTIMEAAVVVLREAGGPLGPRELSQRLQTMGVRCSANVLRAKLCQCTRDLILRAGPSLYEANSGRHNEIRRRREAALAGADLGAYHASAVALFELGQPATAEKITELILAPRADTGGPLWRTAGHTPSRTVSEKLAIGVLDQIDKVRAGLYALSLAALNQPVGVKATCPLHGSAAPGGGSLSVAKGHILALVQAVTDRELEHLVGLLLERLGYHEVVVTPRTGDGGIDATAVFHMGGDVPANVVAQVKRESGRIRPAKIHELAGAADFCGPRRSPIFVTTGSFSSGARKAAEGHNITLWEGERLVELLIETRLCCELPSRT